MISRTLSNMSKCLEVMYANRAPAISLRAPCTEGTHVSFSPASVRLHAEYSAPSRPADVASVNKAHLLSYSDTWRMKRRGDGETGVRLHICVPSSVFAFGIHLAGFSASGGGVSL